MSTTRSAGLGPTGPTGQPGDSLKGCGPDEALEVCEVVFTKRQVCRQRLKPARLQDVRTRTRLDGRSPADELREVAVTHPAPIGKSLLENASEDRLWHIHAHLLAHLAAEAVHRGLPLRQATAGSDPPVAPAAPQDRT